MRILAGEAKGRVLKTREGNATRPTDSRAREMLFNIIGQHVIDATFVDLYAGSGSVGMEALSRGAESCAFIEQNAVAARIIRENLRTLGWLERSQVWQTTVQTALRRLGNEGRYFDITFADPPFIKTEELAQLCRRLDEYAATRPTPTAATEPSTAPALLIIQHHRKAQPVLERFTQIESRRAGESALSFFHFT